MPDLTLSLTNAQAARVIAAYRVMVDANGTLPAEGATNAELWAHVKRIQAMQMKNMVKAYEMRLPDDLDTLGS